MLDILLGILKQLSEISVTIFGYKIYLSFLVLVIIVLAAITAVFGVFIKISSKKKAKTELSLYEAYCKITPFHRDAITYLLKDPVVRKENNYILKYMENNYVWYTDEILDKDPGIMIRMNNIILDEVIDIIRDNSIEPKYAIYCFRMLHMMDAMNGGPETVNGKYTPWVCDAISTDDDYNRRARMVLYRVLEVVKESHTYDSKIIDPVIHEVGNEQIPVFSYTDVTKVILTVSMVRYIKDTFMSVDLDDISQSYIRVLASVIVGKPYPTAIREYIDSVG